MFIEERNTWVCYIHEKFLFSLVFTDHSLHRERILNDGFVLICRRFYSLQFRKIRIRGGDSQIVPSIIPSVPIFGMTYCALPEAQHGQSVPLLLYFGIYSIADFKVLQVSTIELVSRLSGRRSQELTRRGNVNAFYVDKVIAVSLDGLFATQSGGQPDADEGLRISAGTG